MYIGRMYFYHVLRFIIPLTRFFYLKRLILRWGGLTLGENVRCASSASFYLSGSLSVGDETWIGHDVLIMGGDASVSIGRNCDIAPRVSFITGSHKISPLGTRVAGEGYSLPITIGDGSWICAGAIILGGTTIGERSIVAAGAVVKGNFPPGSLIGGVPARVLRDTLSADIGEQA